MLFTWSLINEKGELSSLTRARSFNYIYDTSLAFMCLEIQVSSNQFTSS